MELASHWILRTDYYIDTKQFMIRENWVLLLSKVARACFVIAGKFSRSLSTNLRGHISLRPGLYIV